MSNTNSRRVSRGRKLTPEEAAKYRAIRAQVEADKPEINARIRAQMAGKSGLATSHTDCNAVTDDETADPCDSGKQDKDVSPQIPDAREYS